MHVANCRVRSPFPKATQDGDGVDDAGLLHQDLLEAPLQGWILSTQGNRVYICFSTLKHQGAHDGALMTVHHQHFLQADQMFSDIKH